jgi:hypothetical protein
MHPSGDGEREREREREREFYVSFMASSFYG